MPIKDMRWPQWALGKQSPQITSRTAAKKGLTQPSHILLVYVQWQVLYHGKMVGLLLESEKLLSLDTELWLHERGQNLHGFMFSYTQPLAADLTYCLCCTSKGWYLQLLQILVCNKLVVHQQVDFIVLQIPRKKRKQIRDKYRN